MKVFLNSFIMFLTMHVLVNTEACLGKRNKPKQNKYLFFEIST